MKKLRASLPGRLIFGVKGDPGAVFRPNVDEEGTISWTNNGGLANPAPQNIRGPKGEKGDNIFPAEYGVSTYEQVTAAMDKDLLCVAEFLFWRLPMVLCGVKWGGAYFSGYDPNGQQMVWVSLSTDGIWDHGFVPMKVVETIGEDSLETEIPTAKAVQKAVAAVKNFVAEYGITTFAEIRAEWGQKKACFCIEGGNLAILVSITADRAEFCSLLAPGGLATGYSVTSGNVWSTESEVRIKTKMVNALSTDDQIPTAKAVYNAIIAAEKDTFVGDNSTTVAEFNEAFASRKVCFMIRPQGGSGNVMWVAYNCSSAYAHFYNITSGGAVQHGVLDSNGEFATTTVGISDDKIAEAVKEYMDSGQNPTVELDTTLTQSGKAADAKAVGDALASVGNPTDEQVSAAVNAYLAEHPVDGSMSTEAKELLLIILQNASFKSEQATNLANLAKALSMSEVPGEDTETWDYEWNYEDGVALTSSGWEVSGSTGQMETSFDAEKGQIIRLKENTGAHYLYKLFLRNANFLNAENGVMECVVNMVTAVDASSLGYGLWLELTNGTTSGSVGMTSKGWIFSSNYFGAVPTEGVDYTVRVAYTSDTVVVSVDGAEIINQATVPADESGYGVYRQTSCIMLMGAGDFVIKSVKYRGGVQNDFL